MIKPNELRIGNTVFNEYSGVSVVESVRMHHIEYRALQGRMTGLDHVSAFTPIPITEEWLMKLGSKKIYKSNTHSSYQISNRLIYYFWYDTKKLYATFEGSSVSCKYIHQLQNPFFALTGEELTIQP